MRILSAEFLTVDLKGTADFYNTVLGLPLLDSGDEVIRMAAGRTNIQFSKTTQGDPVYHIAFNIPYGLVDDAARYMSRRVALIGHEGKYIVEFSAWNARAFYFEDNNGNILEFIGRKDIAGSPGLTFTSASIECVSEVAVVTDNVHALVRVLTRTTGLTTYEKQPVLENFAAMGDANGLLILSSENRHWFPTEVPSKKHPVKIYAEINGTLVPLEFNC